MQKKFKLLTPFLVLTMVLILTVGLSFSATREATFGYKNSNNVYRLTGTRDTAGAYINTSPTGVGKTPGYEVFADSGATNRLDASDSGRRLISTGTHGSHFILPTAAPGLEIEVCTGTVSYVTVDTHSVTETIHFSIAGAVLAAGDSLLSPGQAGDCVRVTAGSTGNWYVTNIGFATWTDNGTE